MDKKHAQESDNHESFRRAGNAVSGLTFRLLAAALVFYWLGEIVMSFVRGGPEAPSLTLLLLSCVVLGGGGILVIVLAIKGYKLDKAAAQMTPEEVEAMERLRAEDDKDSDPSFK